MAAEEAPKLHTPEQIAADRLRDDLEIARAVGHERPRLSDMPWQPPSHAAENPVLIAMYQRGDDQAVFITAGRRVDGMIQLADADPLAFSWPEWLAFALGAKAGEFRFGEPERPTPDDMKQGSLLELPIAPTERRLVLAVDRYPTIGHIVLTPAQSALKQAA